MNSRTPPAQVDRVLFSNYVFLVGTALNVLVAVLNLNQRYFLPFALNVIDQVAIVLGLVLNGRQRFIAARSVFLLLFYASLTFGCAFQGPVAGYEYYFLVFTVLAFSMFRPAERKYSFAFAIAAAGLYVFFASQPAPLIEVGPPHHYTKMDLLANQVFSTVLLIVCVLGMSNAYGRAIKVVDDQRAKLFEAGRLTALGSMACSIAHEINTPLMAIDLQLDELTSRAGTDASRGDDVRAYDRLGQLSSRIATIVRGFKLLSYSESDDQLIAIELGTLVDRARRVMDGRMKPLGIQATVELHDPQARLRVRRVALSQVLLELLSNASDAVAELAPVDRWIRISSGMRDGRLWIAVADAGKVRPESTVRWFEPFETTKPLGKGVGLGLTMSKRTVEGHGGRLYVDPDAPTTTLVIELPP